MKSLKDALTLYRTLAAEALSEFSYSERGESLGRHLDDLAWRLSTRVRPPRKPTDMSEAWQNVGYLSDEGIDFGALIERVEQDSAEVARRYLDGVAAHLYVGPTSAVTVSALFGSSEDRAARQAQEMREAIAPVLKKLAGGPEGLEWSVSETRTAEAVSKVAQAIRSTLEIPSQLNEIQTGINDMVHRHLAEQRRLHEHAFLREVEWATGWTPTLSDPAATVEDNPTT